MLGLDSILKYENDNWNKVYTVYNNSTNGLIGYNLINNNFYILESNDNSGFFYKFTGNDITKIMDLNKFKVNGIDGCFAGNTETDLLYSCYLSIDSFGHLFNWNGSKWSKELRIGFGPAYARGFQNTYIAIYEGTGITYIYKGTRK